MTVEAIIWDLDGTLLDSLQDLAESANAVLEAQGVPIHPVEDYRYFVGDGVHELMRRILPEGRRSTPQVEEAVAQMKAAYAQNWNVRTCPYRGIPEVLENIQARNIPMAVFSNKPDVFTRQCVDYFFRKGIFAEVRGQGPETPLKPSPDGALAICRNLDVDPAGCLYLGDTSTDMKTGVSAGMRPIGVLWGFRGREELTDAGAADLIETPEAIYHLIR